MTNDDIRKTHVILDTNPIVLSFLASYWTTLIRRALVGCELSLPKVSLTEDQFCIIRYEGTVLFSHRPLPKAMFDALMDELKRVFYVENVLVTVGSNGDELEEGSEYRRYTFTLK